MKESSQQNRKYSNQINLEVELEDDNHGSLQPDPSSIRHQFKQFGQNPAQSRTPHGNADYLKVGCYDDDRVMDGKNSNMIFQGGGNLQQYCNNGQQQLPRQNCNQRLQYIMQSQHHNNNTYAQLQPNPIKQQKQIAQQLELSGMVATNPVARSGETTQPMQNSGGMRTTRTRGAGHNSNPNSGANKLPQPNIKIDKISRSVGGNRTFSMQLSELEVQRIIKILPEAFKLMKSSSHVKSSSKGAKISHLDSQLENKINQDIYSDEGIENNQKHYKIISDDPNKRTMRSRINKNKLKNKTQQNLLKNSKQQKQKDFQAVTDPFDQNKQKAEKAQNIDAGVQQKQLEKAASIQKKENAAKASDVGAQGQKKKRNRSQSRNINTIVQNQIRKKYKHLISVQDGYIDFSIDKNDSFAQQKAKQESVYHYPEQSHNIKGKGDFARHLISHKEETQQIKNEGQAIKNKKKKANNFQIVQEYKKKEKQINEQSENSSYESQQQQYKIKSSKQTIIKEKKKEKQIRKKLANKDSSQKQQKQQLQILDEKKLGIKQIPQESYNEIESYQRQMNTIPPLASGLPRYNPQAGIVSPHSFQAVAPSFASSATEANQSQNLLKMFGLTPTAPSLSPLQKTFCVNLLSALKSHPSSHFFRLPVNPKTQRVPDYFQAIYKPMDLSTISSKLRKNLYCCVEEVHADINLIFLNSYKYNIRGTKLFYSTVEFEDYYWSLIKQIQQKPSQWANESTSSHPHAQGKAAKGGKGGKGVRNIWNSKTIGQLQFMDPTPKKKKSSGANAGNRHGKNVYKQFDKQSSYKMQAGKKGKSKAGIFDANNSFRQEKPNSIGEGASSWIFEGGVSQNGLKNKIFENEQNFNQNTIFSNAKTRTLKNSRADIANIQVKKFQQQMLQQLQLPENIESDKRQQYKQKEMLIQNPDQNLRIIQKLDQKDKQGQKKGKIVKNYSSKRIKMHDRQRIKTQNNQKKSKRQQFGHDQGEWQDDQSQKQQQYKVKITTSLPKIDNKGIKHTSSQNRNQQVNQPEPGYQAAVSKANEPELINQEPIQESNVDDLCNFQNRKNNDCFSCLLGQDQLMLQNINIQDISNQNDLGLACSNYGNDGLYIQLQPKYEQIFLNPDTLVVNQSKVKASQSKIRNKQQNSLNLKSNADQLRSINPVQKQKNKSKNQAKNADANSKNPDQVKQKQMANILNPSRANDAQIKLLESNEQKLEKLARKPTSSATIKKTIKKIQQQKLQLLFNANNKKQTENPKPLQKIDNPSSNIKLTSPPASQKIAQLSNKEQTIKSINKNINDMDNSSNPINMHYKQSLMHSAYVQQQQQLGQSTDMRKQGKEQYYQHAYPGPHNIEHHQMHLQTIKNYPVGMGHEQPPGYGYQYPHQGQDGHPNQYGYPQYYQEYPPHPHMEDYQGYPNQYHHYMGQYGDQQVHPQEQYLPQYHGNQQQYRYHYGYNFNSQNAEMQMGEQYRNDGNPQYPPYEVNPNEQIDARHAHITVNSMDMPNSYKQHFHQAHMFANAGNATHIDMIIQKNTQHPNSGTTNNSNQQIRQVINQPKPSHPNEPSGMESIPPNTVYGHFNPNYHYNSQSYRHHQQFNMHMHPIQTNNQSIQSHPAQPTILGEAKKQTKAKARVQGHVSGGSGNYVRDKNRIKNRKTKNRAKNEEEQQQYVPQYKPKKFKKIVTPPLPHQFPYLQQIPNALINNVEDKAKQEACRNQMSIYQNRLDGQQKIQTKYEQINMDKQDDQYPHIFASQFENALIQPYKPQNNQVQQFQMAAKYQQTSNNLDIDNQQIAAGLQGAQMVNSSIEKQAKNASKSKSKEKSRQIHNIHIENANQQIAKQKEKEKPNYKEKQSKKQKKKEEQDQQYVMEEEYLQPRPGKKVKNLSHINLNSITVPLSASQSFDFQLSKSKSVTKKRKNKTSSGIGLIQGSQIIGNFQDDINTRSKIRQSMEKNQQNQQSIVSNLHSQIQPVHQIDDNFTGNPHIEAGNQNDNKLNNRPEIKDNEGIRPQHQSIQNELSDLSKMQIRGQQQQLHMQEGQKQQQFKMQQ